MIIGLAGRTRPAVDTENGNKRRFLRGSAAAWIPLPIAAARSADLIS